MAKEKHKATSGAVISPDLISTLELHPEIKEVHFRTDGKHVFHAYDHKGEKYGMITTEEIVGNDHKKSVVKTPILNTRIIETMSRAEILGTEDK